jgi:glycosyltransferase involved in cell wall biosynthesis
VIPTRNRPQLVTRAVRSALKQTHESIEVIVVIDGPDPPSELALQGIDDARLRIIVLPSGVGACGARNAGVQAAVGEWIGLLDDDDEWLPEKISKQLGAAREAECPYPIVTSRLFARSPLREYVWPRRLPSEGEPISEYVLARHGLFQGEGMVNTTTLFVRRSFFLEVPFTNGLQRHQEWDWLFRALGIKGTALVFAKDPLAIWYIDETRPTISNGSDWRYSRDWIDRMQALITPRAYSAFLLTFVAARAVQSGARSECLKLIVDAARRGRPTAIDILLFLGIFIVPQQPRRRLRAALSR